MSSIEQDPNTFSGEKENLAESSSLEAIENLAKLLKEQFGRPQKQPLDTGNLLDGDIESIETQLDALKMGRPPDGLTEEVRKAWNSIENNWACCASSEKFRIVLDQLLDPLKRTVNEVEQLEKEIELRKERLKTLQMLVDLLDELN